MASAYHKFNSRVAQHGAETVAKEIADKYQRIGIPPDMWIRLAAELQALVPKPTGEWMTHGERNAASSAHSKKVSGRQMRDWEMRLHTAVSTLAWHEAKNADRKQPPKFEAGLSVEAALAQVCKRATDWWAILVAPPVTKPLFVLQAAHDIFGTPRRAFTKRQLASLLVDKTGVTKETAELAADDFLCAQKAQRAQERQRAKEAAAIKREQANVRREEAQERKTWWRLAEVSKATGLSSGVLRRRIQAGLLPVADYASTQYSGTETTLHTPAAIRTFLAAHFPHIDAAFLDSGSVRERKQVERDTGKSRLDDVQAGLEALALAKPHLYQRRPTSFAGTPGVAGLSAKLDCTRLAAALPYHPQATVEGLEQELAWWKTTLSARLNARLEALDWTPAQRLAVRATNMSQTLGSVPVQWPAALKEAAALDVIEQTLSQLLGAFLRTHVDQFDRLGLLDPAQPRTWFEPARRLARKWVLHLGPTNSGTTHDAMQALFKAPNGVYLAPLRLLALEAYDRLIAQNLGAGLVTGEEREQWLPQQTDGATQPNHCAATIEAGVGLNREWELAVVDEAQLIGDEQRGWAWTQALTGLRAKEIHVCAAPAAEHVLLALAEQLGEAVEIRRHERLTPLSALDKPIALKSVQAGDALVAFSRRQVLSYRAWLRQRGVSVAVLYGDLGPEVRRAESDRFRSGEAQVLVATDAIGMGLNLPIKRVIFAETEKFDGKRRRGLQVNEWKQIAGRAGRKGLYPQGWYGTLAGASPLSTHTGSMMKPRFRPTPEVVQRLAALLGWTTLREVVDFWSECAGPDLVPPSEWENTGLVKALSGSGLPLLTQYHYLHAPLGRQTLAELLGAWVARHAKGMAIAPPKIDEAPAQASTPAALAELEALALRLRLYRWCALAFPEAYPHASQEAHEKIARAIMDSLQNQLLLNRCDECGRELKVDHPHAKCDPCFRAGRNDWFDNEYW